ncbi:MAG: hypothetical protein IMW93_10245 [Thermoanaerobacteraceae bacterium]|nr:hypothetical protein [Thermoanaerobacteraceae bacterium]
MHFQHGQEHPFFLDMINVVLNEVDIGIHVVDAAGVSIFYNAARLLGIPRQTLQYKIKNYGIKS